MFLHHWRILEALTWAVAASVMTDGYRFESPQTGFHVSLLGLALSLPAFAYSASLNPISMSPESRTQLVYSWLGLTLLPATIALNSTLLGYLTVIAFYSVLGLSGATTGLCTMIGFDSKAALERVGATSMVVISAFVGANVVDYHPAMLGPFESAIQVIGVLSLHLSFLIFASAFYKSGLSYATRNVFTAATLLLTLLASTVLGLTGMANTTLVFVCLFLTEKYMDIHQKMGWNQWWLVLVMSTIMYLVSLRIHKHPEILAQLL